MAGKTPITDKTRPPLIFSAHLKATPQAVFDAFFRDATRWLCRESSVDAQVGGDLRMCWPDGCYVGRFVQCEPPVTARFSWQMEGDALPATMVVVRADPVPSSDHTAFELEHYGFGAGPDWDLLYLSATRAWAAYLKNLKAFIEAGLDLREADE